MSDLLLELGATRCALIQMCGSLEAAEAEIERHRVAMRKLLGEPSGCSLQDSRPSARVEHSPAATLQDET